MRSRRCVALCALCLIAVSALLLCRVHADDGDGLRYTPEQIRSIPAATFLERMQTPQSGYHRFAALWALTEKVKGSTSGVQRSIMSMVISAMHDTRRTEYQRFQCCYVISGSGYEEGIPDLIRILLQDKSEVMRSVAVEALGKFKGNKTAYDALLQAARIEPSQRVRNTLAKYLGKDMPALDPNLIPAPVTAVEELAPSGAPELPAGPERPVDNPLPWPFPGDCKAQKIFNNYQTMPDGYIHCGLDFIHPAGTPVRAVSSGYVTAIWSREPHTHDFFIVTPEKDGRAGWCYTHMDPQTFTFNKGDHVKEGQELGKLVKFSVDGKPGMDHLHLHYVTFKTDSSGNVIPPTHSVMDPLYFFDWADTVPPSFQHLRFVSAGTLTQFAADSSGAMTVSGKVDILAAINDIAYPGEKSLFGVPVVMLSISDGTHTMQKLVVDHRGDVGDEKQTGPLYLSRTDSRAMTNPDSWFPYYQVLRVTKSDGDGKIEPEDANECWDTTARDASGKPLWPDGKYSVNVYAWDIAGNRSAAGAVVQVRNQSTVR